MDQKSCVTRNERVTYVAPIRINSIVLDLVSKEKIMRKSIVDAMTMTIRPEVLLTILHRTTGPSSRIIIKSNKIALAVSRICVPGCI